jgi:nitrogen fixation protein NifZ
MIAKENPMRETEPDEPDLRSPPVFLPGTKVCANRMIRNDGTFAGRDVGDVLVKKGDVGYVRDVGTFLQRHYIYAVEWVDRGIVVGMRSRELDEVPFAPAKTAASAAVPAAAGALR